MRNYLLFPLLLGCFSFVLSSRILLLSPLGPRSHMHNYMPMVESLAERGHQLTLVTAHYPKTNSSNIQKIVLPELIDIVEGEWYDFKAHGLFDAISAVQNFRLTASLAYNIFFANEKIQKIKQEKNFDIIIFDGICNDFILPLVEHLGVPFISVDPGCGTPWNLAAQDISQEYATVPMQFTGFETLMSYSQRAANFIFTETLLFFRQYYLLGALDKLARKDFPNASPISQIERKADLYFANIHPAICPPRSLPPTLIPLGGMHVRPVKPLPKDLQDFADGAEHGLIVFTLGSNSRVSSMPIHIQQTFHRVFSRLQQRVIWKWETGNFEPLPNVKMVDWLPQQDLLGHANTRLFIAHGGQLGIQEAIYHAVPVLGLPLGRDQRSVLMQASEEGYSLKLEWEEVTDESLYTTIQTMLNNKTFKDNATRMSRLMHDELIPSKEVGVYWVEYVLRNGGAKHLHKKSKAMPLYQLYLLDSVSSAFGKSLCQKLAFTLVIQLFVACRAGRILVLAPVCSKSHKFSFMPLMEGLAKKGHQVTVVTPFLPSKPVDNIREITTGDIFEEISIDWFEAQRQNTAVAIADILIKFREIMRKGYNQLMNNKEFKEILQSRETDLIIVDAILNEFTLPIIDHFNVPFIFYCPAASVPWVVNAMSIPPEYAYVPGGMNDNGSRMTFVQRMGNMLSSEVFLWLRQIFLLNMLDDFASKDFPNSRSVAVIERDADLCFINSHPATAWARPLPMNVIPLGATHVRPANTLPEELQLLVDNANQGFIVFTLGSAIPVSSMPKELVEIFVRVFARIPQLVFWKWEKDSIAIELSPNVKVMNWLPQQDLLGHKNARLFMSHGGLLGIQETVYHGVPLLGIPFGNDQRGNLAKAREEGYGLKLDWDTITEETLYSTIQTLLHEPSYAGNASRLSGLMKSQLTSTREVGVYWVEYVLQHGGKHLRSRSSEMSFHQRHLLDVWLILTAVSLTFLFITFKLLTCFIKSFKIFKVKTQ